MLASLCDDDDDDDDDDGGGDKCLQLARSTLWYINVWILSRVSSTSGRRVRLVGVYSYGPDYSYGMYVSRVFATGPELSRARVHTYSAQLHFYILLYSHSLTHGAGVSGSG